MSTENDPLSNDQITALQVRLIHPAIGFNAVMDTKDALQIAASEGLDLIQVSDQDIPVVKLFDLNKYLFDQKQKEKQLKKSQRASCVKYKEIQLSLNIQPNDMQTMANRATSFLTEGKHLKITIRLTGRARSSSTMQQLSIDKIETFLGLIPEHEVQQQPMVGGGLITCLVKPLDKK